jgi:hypothetical protein
MRRTAIIACGVFAAALAAFAVFSVAPWLDRKHDFASSVPQPPPLDTTDLIVVLPHGQMCMNDVAVEPHGNQVRFKAGTYFKPGPPVTLTVRGVDYEAATRVSAGFADNAVLQLPIRPPPRAELVTVCIRNDGSRKISLYSASGRSRSRSVVTLNGKVQKPAPDLAFYESRPVSIGDRVSTILGRMAVFRGVFGEPWIFWALSLLLVFGVPLAIGAGLWLAFARAPAEH